MSLKRTGAIGKRIAEREEKKILCPNKRTSQEDWQLENNFFFNTPLRRVERLTKIEALTFSAWIRGQLEVGCTFTRES
jgi:hypothetical protein